MFDECHRAKNLCPVGSSKPTKTGLTVLELQKQLPKARIVYASATGASEPKNMAYMVRLGIWGEGTPFNEFTDFISAVEKRYGDGASGDGLGDWGVCGVNRDCFFSVTESTAGRGYVLARYPVL